MSSIFLPIRWFAVGVLLSALLLAACNKRSDSPGNAVPPIQVSMTGNWHIDSVNSFFYNADGSPRGTQVFAGQPDYYYHFQADHSWQESFTPDVTSNLTMNGTYVSTSDSTFILVTPGAIPKDDSLSCKILSLTNTSFVFSKRRITVYNGTEPGYMDYVFHMKK